MEHPGVPCAREVESCPVAISGLPSESNGLCLVLARLTTLFNLRASVSSYHSIPRTIYNYGNLFYPGDFAHRFVQRY